MRMRALKYGGIVLLALALGSCTSSKKILYFQDIDSRDLQPIETEYEAIIKKDDRLTIVVSGPDKSVTAPYNLTLSEITTGAASTNPEQSTLSYLVDPEGNIEFPTLGTLHVEGMTRHQLMEYLTEEIGKDVKDPIVYVAIKNYKITVLGEVRSPGTYTMDSEKINILQALGRAGDLNITAKRENILLIREVDGKLTHITIDLKNSDILESPYFYLQQNDILYIPPSATRIMTATTATGIWGTILSSITTMIALIKFLE